MSIAIVLAIGAVAGLFAGLLGIGGGVIMTPLLLLLFESQGMAKADAVVGALASSLAATVFTSIPSASVHAYHRSLKWRVLAVLAPASLIGAALSATLALRTPPSLLIAALATFMLISVWQVLRKKNVESSPPVQPGATRVAAIGLGAGAIGAFTGTGGGIVVAPMLHRLGLPLINCIGTSAGNVMFVGISATLVYAERGLDLHVLGVLGPSCMVGAVAGSWLANKLPLAKLRLVYAIPLTLIALELMLGLVGSTVDTI